MNKYKNNPLMVLVSILVLTLALSGCSFSEKASTLKEDLVNITLDQIAQQLQNSLNEQFPGVAVNTPQVIDSKGQVNWDKLKQTELANYVFYNVGDYEFNAVLNGDGNFKIRRINHATGESFSYAEFKVERVNGKFVVTAK